MMPADSPRTKQRVVAAPPPRCALCQGDDFRIRFAATDPDPTPDPSAFRCTSFDHRRHATIWECRSCGLVVQWPQPRDETLESAYRAVEDPVYAAERENRYLTFRHVVEQLGPGQGRRLLDVGAYCGYFLDVAADAGFDPEGLELSSWAAEEARRLGHTVHEKRLGDLVAAGEAYDVVTMWDVLEHLADPIAELAAVRQLLRPGGQLYLSTIDVHSRLARAMGRRWPWLMEMHLIYFDRGTVRQVLEQAGLRPVATRSYTHVVSARYLLSKVAATLPSSGPVLRRLQARVPPGWRVPINVGDNLLVVAERDT